MPRQTTHIDDRPEERESPVRHAHAVAASRHGRASAPGYLGLPADDAPEHDLSAAESEEPDDEQETDDEQEPDEEQDRPQRAPRARARATATSKSSKGADKGDGPHSQGATRKAAPRSKGKQKRSQGGTSRDSSKGRTRAPTAKAASAGRAASNGRQGGGKGQSNKRASSRSARGGGGPSKGAGRRRAQAVAASVKSKAAETALGAEHEMGKRALRGALRVGGALARRAVVAASRRAGQAVTRAGARGIDGVIERAHRLPIQQSIDVAVPPEIAWEQWMEFEHLPEGTHRLTEVERDGDELTGMIDGLRDRDWSAEVIDEREQESFAWRSTEGSDSAGLVTFHPLSERLTRVEVTIDVLPEGLSDAARLMLRIADRRVEEELRRFKADAELLNPDVYEELLASAGNGGSDDEESG